MINTVVGILWQFACWLCGVIFAPLNPFLAFFLFVVGTIGLANVLVHGVVLDDDHLGLRTWLRGKLGGYHDMLDCHECCGFWSGMFMCFVLVSWNPLVVFAAGFVGCGVMHAYLIAANYIESKTDFLVGDGGTENEKNDLL